MNLPRETEVTVRLDEMLHRYLVEAGKQYGQPPSEYLKSLIMADALKTAARADRRKATV